MQIAAMSILHLHVTFLLCLLKSQRQLVVENLTLRQQVAMLRQSMKRPRPLSGRQTFLDILFTLSAWMA